MTLAEEMPELVQRVAQEIGPSVLTVGRGAGVVVGDGLVLTNAHNLRGREGRVRFADGREAHGEVRGADFDGDLAVLAVDTAAAPVVGWAERGIQLGDVVVAVANPRSRGLRATVGTISSTDTSFRGPRGKRITGGLEHTAPLGRGSSGSALAGTDGRVIGINTHRLQDGFYMALPVDEALQRKISELAEGREPVSRRLGVALAPPQAARHLRAAAGLPEVDGLLIRVVEEGGAAERAGMRRGDVMVSAAGHHLGSVDDLHTALEEDAATLEIGLVRATEELTVTVRFGE